MRNAIVVWVLTFCFCCCAIETISTIAGTGKPGFSGDGGPALAATFSKVRGLAVDAAGNLFLADTDNHRIRRIGRDGVITTVAGTGTPGYSGDGGTALNATLREPGGLAFDAAGNLYIADELNHVVRKIDTAGVISTVAGSGVQGSNGENVPALQAQLSRPSGVAVDSSGNLYISSQNRIRRVNSAGTMATLAGNGEQGFAGDGGPAVNAQFHGADALAIDITGNLLIVDIDNNRIRRIDLSSGIITTVAGTGVAGYSGDGGPAINAQLGFPGDGFAADKLGNYYFGDYGANENQPRLRRVSKDGIISTIAGTGVGGSTGDGGPASSARVLGIAAIATTPSGDLYFSEDFSEEIARPGGQPGETDDRLIETRIRKISVNDPGIVENPVNGMTVQVAGRTAGEIELAIDVNALNRALFDVETEFTDIPTKAAVAAGLRPKHQFTSSGIFVATSRAFEAGTRNERGIMRKTLPINRSETGEPALVTSAPADRGISRFNVKGKFLFSESKDDSVSFSGDLELPAGLNTSSKQRIYIAAGNIVDDVEIDVKGKAMLPSSNQFIKKLQVTFPKTGSSMGKVSFTLQRKGLVAQGFNTEGVSASVPIPPKSKGAGIGIQVALVIGGVAYEIKAPVLLKTKGDAAQIQGKSAK
ncbi:MAG TPA: NHL repeat-containing protein [Planctomycetota bacterium]|nr:NHL repeat-containing protein [Planctomycetota bacterium]